jgi:multidrug resistance efflux pump
VKAGQIIARLDDAPFIAALHSAERNLAAAKSDLHAAQLNASRPSMGSSPHAMLMSAKQSPPA